MVTFRWMFKDQVKGSQIRLTEDLVESSLTSTCVFLTKPESVESGLSSGLAPVSGLAPDSGLDLVCVVIVTLVVAVTWVSVPKTVESVPPEGVESEI